MTDLADLYQEVILDHARRRSGEGLAEPAPEHACGESHQYNPTCGDEITVRVAADLSDISYDGVGCSISQASASVLHDQLTGRDADAAFRVHDAFVELMQGRGQVEPDEEVLGDGVAFAGVARYPARVKCALLPWMAFKDAAVRAGVGVSPEVTA